jgi:hypothetical protein
MFNHHCSSLDLTLVAVVPFFLSQVKPISYLRLKTTYPRRHRPIKQSRGTGYAIEVQEQEPSIVATSRGPCDPNGARAPDGSIIYVFRSKSTVDFT